MKKIVSGRIAQVRAVRGLKQREIVEELRKAFPEATFSESLISAWETGRRHVPTKYENKLAEIYGVSKEWLYGVTNKPNGNKSDYPSRFLISAEEMPNYDGLPVWVEFTTFEFISSWAIWNDAKNTLIFKDGIRKIKRKDDIRIYSALPDYVIEHRRPLKGLNIEQVMKCKMVYVKMSSPDPAIRASYNGWYINNENKSGLINEETGLTLPYSGLRVSYLAYADDVFGKPKRDIN